MTTSILIFALLVWASLVGLAVMLLRQPKKRKTQDELEALVAALKNRVIDLEDRLEHFVKREAVRRGRETKDAAQGDLDLGNNPLASRRATLEALRTKVARDRMARGTL